MKRRRWMRAWALLLLCVCIFPSGAQAQEQLQYRTDGEGNVCVTGVPEGWTRVEIPGFIGGERVTALADGLLEGRRELTEVILPDSLRAIPDRCFAGCTRLKKVTLPEGLSEIGAYAFAGCSNLKELTLPRLLRSMGDGALIYTALERMELSEGLERLGAGVFTGCERLSEIVMRSRLREIDAAAFAGCGARLTVEYGSDAERFLQEQGLEYDYAWREARGWIYRRGGQGVTVLGSRRGRTQEYIPERLSGAAVTEVGAGAFQADPALRQVYFAGTLRTVGDWAFSYCPVLEEIVLNEII